MNNKSIAIITGASSGIGKEFTSIINGYDDITEIWAIARNQDRLNDLKHTLSEKVRIFSMDLTDAKAWRQSNYYSKAKSPVSSILSTAQALPYSAIIRISQRTEA